MRANPVAPVWRYDYCYSNTALVWAGEDGIRLAFCPIDTRDLLYIEHEDASSSQRLGDIEGLAPARGMAPSTGDNTYERTIFSIEEAGSSQFTLAVDEAARERIKLLGPREIEAILERFTKRNG